MTFRKDLLLFYQFETFVVILAIIPIIMIHQIGFLPLLVFSLPFSFVAVLYPLFQNEYITINESGIECNNTKTKNQLWAYKWSEIAVLKKSSTYNFPSVDVIIYGKDGKPEKFSGGRYFLLCKTAKKALNMYAGDLWPSNR